MRALLAALILSAAAEAAAAGKVITTAFPQEVLHSIGGCWQFDDKERLTVTATSSGGAQAVRSHLAFAEPDSGWARRAALPSEVMYDTSDGSLAFTTAGRIHGLMFIFRAEPDALQGDWYSKHDQTGYHWTGSRSTLKRCP